MIQFRNIFHKYAQWITFGLFTLLLFIKMVTFHYEVFRSILISSIFTEPFEFIRFYLIKFIPALFFGAFVLISRVNKWWTIVVSFLIDVWCLCNIVYFKTYDMFLTIDDILLVNNMDGAWSSVLGYIDIGILSLFCGTIVWSIFVWYIHSYVGKRYWGWFLVSLLLVFGVSVGNNYYLFENFDTVADKETFEAENNWRKLERMNESDIFMRYSYKLINVPYMRTYYGVRSGEIDDYTFIQESKSSIQRSTILAYIPQILIRYCCRKHDNISALCLSNSEKEEINNYLYSTAIQDNSLLVKPKTNLILLLVESLEMWPIEHMVAGVNVTPFLSQLRHKEHVFYAGKMTSQALKGNSGDGQMIVNTGLLPISEGVACMSFGNNVYPNFAQFYDNSVIVNPWPHIWNQDTMAIRYGYKNLLECYAKTWTDGELLDTAYATISTKSQPFCAMIITSSTHTPFYGFENRLKFNDEVPVLMKRYLNCLNYTDSCVEAFCQHVWDNPKLTNSTIVITGDHTIFKSAMLNEFSDFIHRQHLSLESGENYTSMFIYSPLILGNHQYLDVCYQMDVYPTILGILDKKNIYWQGLGMDLLDSTTIRSCSEEDAYRLSNMIIKSDYFSTFSHN